MTEKLLTELLQVETQSLANFLFSLIEHGYLSLRNLTTVVAQEGGGEGSGSGGKGGGGKVLALTKLWMKISPTQLLVLKVQSSSSSVHDNI